jgi:hypothetical protein
MKLCTIEGCGSRHYAHGLCNRHYMQVRRSNLIKVSKRKSPETRFWPRVQIGEINDCWPWTGGRFDNGYGAFAMKGRSNVRAHRYVYELTNGSIPPGMVVLHSCDNPPCCNPLHLAVGTQQDNVDDRNRKLRQARGEAAGSAKLTKEQVVVIRSDPREQRAIAADYGVCKSTIGYIKRRESWRTP